MYKPISIAIAQLKYYGLPCDGHFHNIVCFSSVIVFFEIIRLLYFPNSATFEIPSFSMNKFELRKKALKWPKYRNFEWIKFVFTLYKDTSPYKPWDNNTLNYWLVCPIYLYFYTSNQIPQTTRYAPPPIITICPVGRIYQIYSCFYTGIVQMKICYRAVSSTFSSL